MGGVELALDIGEPPLLVLLSDSLDLKAFSTAVELTVADFLCRCCRTRLMFKGDDWLEELASTLYSIGIGQRRL